MPELPDIAVYINALRERISGRALEQVRLGSPFLLRTASPPLSNVHGRNVIEIRRVGKRIAVGLEGGLWMVLHLMIAGRLHWRQAARKVSPKGSLASFDFSEGSLVLTEAGTQRRASLHVVEGEAGLKSLDPGGLEVMTADFTAFSAALTAENHTLKRALTDPRTFSGIGNAYSDEILHHARLSPILQSRKMSAEETRRLFASVQTVLSEWESRLEAERKGGFPEKVTAFREEMAVHGRFGLPCPRCGAKVQRIRYASNETNYCATCQTGGKLLADRGLSRLLGKDWPKTLEELEALPRRASAP